MRRNLPAVSLFDANLDARRRDNTNRFTPTRCPCGLNQSRGRQLIASPQLSSSRSCLLSRIGPPITEPQVFDVKVRLQDTRQFQSLVLRITEAAQEEFATIDSIWREAVPVH